MKKISMLLICLLTVGSFKTFAQSGCNAQYSWAPSQSTSSNALGVIFTNTSTGASGTLGYNTTSSIAFGDGSSSYIGSSVFHNYSSPGTYNTMLIVQTTDSLSATVVCTDTAYQSVTINYLPCAVAISAVDNNDGTATFTANALGSTTGMTYAWSFGDGNTGTGTPVTHPYGGSGYYWILLTSTGTGCSGSDSLYFHHNDTTSINCSSLAADFGDIVYGLDVSFSNNSTYAAANVSNQADWYFGDGNSQTGVYGNANHTYPGVGSFNVTMVNHWVDSISGQLYCVDSVTKLVTIDSATFPNAIGGTLNWGFAGSTGNSDSFKIWLITYDSVANTLTAVDSTYSSPQYPEYWFYNPPSGNYLVKAALLNQTPGSVGLIPTYYQSSPYWSTATTITYTGGYIDGRNIYMINDTITSGPGFIGGNISSGAGKGTGTGVAGMQVYLRGANNALLGSSLTDANGNYSFSNIPLGTYSVYPELINYATTPYSAITVTATQTQVSAIDFEKTADDQILPKEHGTGITKITKEDGLNIYPNPVKDQLIIENNNGLFNKLHIVNTLGQLMLENTLTKNINKIPLSSLNAGIYYLLISGPDNSRSLKIIKE